MSKLKTFRLYPTLFYIDVFVCSKIKRKYLKKRYGLKESIKPNECGTIYSSKKSELKGIKRFYICLESTEYDNIIIHEIVHLLWHLSKEMNIELKYESQEWQANFFEMVFNEIKNKNGWV